MLRSNVDFRIRQKHKRHGTSKATKLNTTKLNIINHREIFEQEMDSALAQWEEKESSTPDEEWAAAQQVVYNTAKTYLAKPDKKHQDWFDRNDACRLLQKCTRALTSDWWERKAVELQRAADRNNTKGFYSGLKEMWGPRRRDRFT